jgi:ABC-type multidrug transport system fused ATPase/permease subunit
MKQGAGRSLSSEHVAVYHAAPRCQAASLSLTSLRLHGRLRVCSVEGKNTGGFAFGRQTFLRRFESVTLLGSFKGRRRIGSVGQMYVADELLPALGGLLRVGGLAGVLLVFHWQLGLLALVTFPFTLWITQGIVKKTRKLDVQLLAVLERGEQILQEVIPNIRQVRIFGQQASEIQRWDEWLSIHHQLKGKAEALHEFVRGPLYSLIDNLGLSLVYGYGAFLVISGQVSLGSLVAMATYTLQFYAALRFVLSMQVRTGDAHTALEAIQELLMLEREWPEQGQPLDWEVRGGLTLQGVTFTYPDSRSGLQDVSLQVVPGEFVGIVGPSGGGKSTIIDLCLRLYEPASGQIVLDGKNTAHVAAQALRRHMGLVSQDVVLWDASIKDNLLYGVEQEIAWEKVVEICQAAQVHDFVTLLPEGYETRVGARGIKLSGGERQRVALARALLRNPSILLLDEATAAQDSITESQMMNALETYASGKTRIVVAHRLSTLQEANRIVVIDDGRVVEIGTPENLLQKAGLYAQLYEAQRLDKNSSVTREKLCETEGGKP